MSKTQSTIAVTVAALLAILAGGWFLLITPQRSEAASLTSEAASVEAANAALTVKLTTLKAQAEGVPAQKAKLAALSQRIPGTAALPTVIRSLTAVATKSGTHVVSITPASPEAVGGTAVTQPTATDGTATTPLATAAPTLSAVPLEVVASGSFVEIERFVNGLEGLKRSFLVTAFTLENPEGTQGGRKLNLTLSGRVFVAAPAVAASVPVTPVAAPAE